MTVEKRQELEEQADKLGREHGHNAGSWVVDGNTSEEQLRWLIQAIDAGDPAFEVPNPLSGEWADEPTTDTVADALGVGEEYRNGYIDLTAEFEVYEAAYYHAYEEQAYKDAKGFLPES